MAEVCQHTSSSSSSSSSSAALGSSLAASVAVAASGAASTANADGSAKKALTYTSHFANVCKMTFCGMLHLHFCQACNSHFIFNMPEKSQVNEGDVVRSLMHVTRKDQQPSTSRDG